MESKQAPSTLGAPPYLRKHKKSYQQRWENTFGKQHVARWHPQSLIELVQKEGKPMLLLMTIGMLASVLDYFVETGVIKLGELRAHILMMDSLQDSEMIKFASWGAFTITIAFAGVMWTRIIDPIAVGSGIPEMKTIISCDQRKEADQFLGSRTLISKAVGLALAMGSGISVGKEGPFVHTASIIAHRLMKTVPFFHRIRLNDILRRHMYNAACAVGVASTFRAPIGGVLFAIEVTSTVFMITNYWRAFVAAMSASISRQLVSLLARETEVTAFHPMFPTTFQSKSFSYPEFAAFAILGVLMGVAGAAYVSLSARFKRTWKVHTATHPLLWAIVMLAMICGVIYIPGRFNRQSFASTLRDLCAPTELPAVWRTPTASIFLILPLSAFCRLVATTFSTSLPLPAGDFIPTFVAGTALGRLFGELIQAAFPDAGIVPGGYALVGGAAFVGSATHTVSVAVIALEFTGQFVYLTPMILAVLLASGVGSALSVSLYESVIISKGLTYLPLLRVNQLEGIKARDVMAIEYPLIPMDTTDSHIQSLLDRYPSFPSFPVVDDVESMVFFGCASRDALCGILESFPLETKADSQMDLAVQGKLDELRAESTGEVGQIVAGGPPTRPLSSLNSTRAHTHEHHRINLRACPNVMIDSSVLQVDSEANVETVHLLFEMIKCARIWVTRRGRLIGLIHRKHLHRQITSLRRDSAASIV